jgi:type I restriction enzyme S subunit
MTEWEERKLGDIINLKRGYDLPNSKRIKGDYPIVSSSGITDYHNEYMKMPPGVVTGRYGTIGKLFFIEKPYWPLNTALYVTDFKGNDPKFIFYFLQSFDFEKFSDKSTVPGINRNHLHSENVLIPLISEQKSIASLLSSLDDKIDLLHRQNATLEKMAETLFRQWFVVEAKDDWQEIPLYDAIVLIGGGTPKTDKYEYWNGGINWLSGGDIASNHKSFILHSEKTITDLGLKSSSAKLLPKFSTVISARGTVGKYCLLSEPMTFSQSNYGIIPKFNDCFFFTYLLIAYSVGELQSAAYGSVFDTITTNTFKGLLITLPETEQIFQFEETVKPYFRKILSNQTQIRTLTALRDTLLPKLMSGEVSVQVKT